MALLHPPQKAARTGIWESHIEGRFRRITVHQLCMGWWLYDAGHITMRQLRVYLAAHEMAERRRYTKDAERPHYGLAEVKALVGGRGSKTASTALSGDVKALGALGLVKITEHAIEFAVSIDQIKIEDVSGFWAFIERIPNNRRAVPVPRRTLRAMAAGFGRAVTAVMIATMIRSLFWHRSDNGKQKQGGESEGSYRIDGRTKGSWITETFRVSRRGVTDARTRLTALGWLLPLETPQYMLNRFGAHDQINPNWKPGQEIAAEATAGERNEVSASHDQINPDWKPGQEIAVAATVGEGGSALSEIAVESASPLADFSAGSASPCLNSSSPSSRENINTRKPAPSRAGPAGVSIQDQEGSRKRKAAEPSLRNIQPDDLQSTVSLMMLYRQAVEVRLARDCEAGLFSFLALAERARAHGRNAPRLFFWLLRENKTQFITQADEDAAAQRLRDYRNGPRRQQWGGEVQAPPSKLRTLTKDEAFVLACERVAAQRGIEYPFFLAKAQGWTRERWDSVRAGIEDERFDVRPRI